MASPTGQSFSFTASVHGTPQLLWTVEITAMCPECGGSADIGSLSGGGSIVVCTKCKWTNALEAVHVRDLEIGVVSLAANKLESAPR